MIDIYPLSRVPSLAPILAYWAYNEWYTDRTVDFNILLRAYQKRAGDDKETQVFVGLVNSLPAGMVSLRRNDLFSCPDLSPWMSSLYVAENFRNRGIGAALTGYVCNKASEDGYGRVYLFLDHERIETLRKFYSSRGWSFLRHSDDNDGNRTEIMQKILE